ncbi:hypothetical protein HZC31_06225 [Candidatus Woesearchaeota archaeon]|nr:hypothetical protein [Candidatus Woesearchaeota archaeon]
MSKQKFIPILFLFTAEQKQILRAKASAAGFKRLSDYVRFVLFMQYGTIEKIDKIYKKICEEDG